MGTKPNDYFLNQMENPDFTAYDFNQMGLNAANTGLMPKSTYQNLSAVQNNPLFLNGQGKFDQNKFDKAYQAAQHGYTQMALNKYTDDVASEATYYKDNLFAPTNQIKNWGPDYTMVRTENPLKQVIGFQGSNIITAGDQSAREIAESVPFYDFTKGKFGIQTPNDTWIGNFFHPKVMATYDKDTDEIDPVTGVMKHHTKGENKIDPVTGTYYYETLGNRSPYGKDILSGWDTITRDGSIANKYDFFDSDDIKKSTFGSMVKAAVKIAPALIPSPIAPWYIGARVGLSTLDLMGKLGKIFTGSDSPNSSYLEAINKTFTESQSDDAQSHPWHIENIVNLSADVFTQLAEQRWIFEQVPKLFTKGINPFTEEGKKVISKDVEQLDVDDLKALLSSEEGQSRLAKISQEYNIPIDDAAMNVANQTKLINTLKIQDVLEKKQHDFFFFLQYLSKAYMTGSTGADSYGDAKQAGVDDIPASIFTLGYAAGEYGIINSALGEWILPELRLERTKMKMAAEKLAGVPIPELNAPKEEKSNFFKRIFNFGKSMANGDYHIMTEKAEATGLNEAITKDGGEILDKAKSLTSKAAAQTAKAVNAAQDATGKVIANVGSTMLDSAPIGKIFAKQVIANALGEGTEEASEELLYDMSKTLFNLSSWFAGSDKRMTAFDAQNGDFSKIPWDQVLNRYALNFVGGVIGGGLGQALPNYRASASLKNMSTEQAWQMAVNLVRENKTDDFIKTIDKM